MLKKFASVKKSCTFVLGLSKEVLSPINLLVISFSVINYVVRVRVHARCVDAHFFCISPFLSLDLPKCPTLRIFAGALAVLRRLRRKNYPRRWQGQRGLTKVGNHFRMRDIIVNSG